MLLLRDFGFHPVFQRGGQDVKNTSNSGAAQVTLLPILPKKPMAGTVFRAVLPVALPWAQMFWA